VLEEALCLKIWPKTDVWLKRIETYHLEKADNKVIWLNLMGVTDALSTMLRLLGKESAEASWLIQARSRMDPVELYNEEW